MLENFNLTNRHSSPIVVAETLPTSTGLLPEILEVLKPSEVTSSSIVGRAKNVILTDVYETQYKSRFKQLNEEETKKGILCSIYKIFERIFVAIVSSLSSLLSAFNLILFSPNFRTKLFLVAEHMSQGVLSGSNLYWTTNNLINLLQKQTNPPLDLIKAIQHQHDYQFSDEKVIKDHAKSLEIDQNIFIESRSSTHEMLLVITCTSIGPNEEKKYRITQHNVGDGVNKYHYRRTTESGEVQYQTAMVIEDVSGEALYGDESTFLEECRSNKHKTTVDYLYENLLPKLGGRIASPSDDDRLWHAWELGDSSAGQAWFSVIRSLLSTQENQEFVDRTTLEFLLELYEVIKKSRGNTTLYQIIALEIISSLEKRYVTEEIDFPDELKMLANELEKISSEETFFSHKKTSRQILDSIWLQAKSAGAEQGKKIELNGILMDISFDEDHLIKSDSVADNLNIAFTLLDQGMPNADLIGKARHFISKAYEKNGAEMSSDELKKLAHLSSEFLAMKSPSQNTFTPQELSICTQQQIHTMTGLVMAALTQLDDALKGVDGDTISDRLLVTVTHRIQAYSQLKTNTYTLNEGLDKRINSMKNGICPPRAPEIPKGLARIMGISEPIFSTDNFVHVCRG